MTSERVKLAVESVNETFDGIVEIDDDQVAEDIEELLVQFKLPVDEAIRSVESKLQQKHDIDDSELYGSSSGEFEAFNLENIEDEYQSANEEDESAWVDVIVKFIEAWEPNSPSIKDVGIVTDGNATTKITVWDNDDQDLPDLEEGEVYRVSNVVIDKYQGRYSLTSTANTEIEVADEEIEDTSGSASGAIVNVHEKSGLIKRCTEDECSRVLDNGTCYEHDEVEGEYDLRVKATLDDGFKPLTVFLDAELTTELTGIDLEDAKERARDALNPSVVRREMESMLVGQYMEVEGTKRDTNFFVDDVELVAGPAEDDLQKIGQLA